MALLDIFGSTPSYYGGLLGEDELNRVRQQAQQQALQNTALALLQAGAPSRTPGNEALAIAQGLAGGQQAYKQTMQEGLQNKMQEMQIQDFMLKQREAQAQRTRQEQMRQMFPQIFTQTVTPEQQTMYGEAARVVRDDEGNLMPGAQITPAQRQISVDPNKLQALAMLSNDPLAAYSQIAKLVPDLRKAGFIGGMQQENPFTIFSKDESIPAPLRAVAAQYERSYATGQIDQEAANKAVETIGQRVQSAQQFAQTQSGLNQQREIMNDLKQQQLAFQQQGLTSSTEYKNLMAQIAQGQLDLRRATEANKPETFSYSQRKEFDVVRKANEEAASAESSAAIADRAAPLLPQAYGGKIEATIKGMAGALGPIGTTQAKEANDQLVQMSQQLALKTPKFSGPTSDADAKRYDKAVGDLANPSVSLTSKQEALKSIKELAQKAKDYAAQQENYFYQNNKSLRGFKYEDNPFGK
jgi:hypothetical protein